MELWVFEPEVQFNSVIQSCPTLCNARDCSMPVSLFITNSQSLLKLISIESVMPSDHCILCHPFLLPPSIFSSIRVFSNESVLCITWPKYWSFSFSLSPSNEYSHLPIGTNPGREGGFPSGASDKELACQCRRDNPWVGKIPGGGNDNALQCSFLDNPMDRCDYLGREDLFCTILLCILATSS